MRKLFTLVQENIEVFKKIYRKLFNFKKKKRTEYFYCKLDICYSYQALLKVVKYAEMTLLTERDNLD